MTCSRPILCLRAIATAARRATVLAAKERQLEEATSRKSYSLKKLQLERSYSLKKAGYTKLPFKVAATWRNDILGEATASGSHRLKKAGCKKLRLERAGFKEGTAETIQAVTAKDKS